MSFIDQLDDLLAPASTAQDESALSQTMTHEAEQPNPARPYMDAFEQLIRPTALDPAPPLWQVNSLDEFLNHPAVQAGLGMAGRVPKWNTIAAESHIKKLRDAGASNADIANEFGVTRNAVIGKLFRMDNPYTPTGNAPGRRISTWTPERTAELNKILDLDETLTQAQIAKRMNMSSSQVANKLWRMSREDVSDVDEFVQNLLSKRKQP